jgi:undecaprenyl-diphosphatase
VKRNIGYFKISAIEFLVAIGVFLFAIALFSLTANEVVFENDNLFDLNVFKFIASYESPAITKIAKFVTNFGSGFFLIPAFLTIIFYLKKVKKIQEAIMVAIVASVSLLSGWLLKDIFHRARPISPLIYGAGGYSFPSGHSLGGFTFSGVLIYLLLLSSIPSYLKWTLSVLLILFAFLIALSRIYLRVHFASDVFGSLLVTIVWLSLTFILLETTEKKSSMNNSRFMDPD